MYTAVLHFIKFDMSLSVQDLFINNMISSNIWNYEYTELIVSDDVHWIFRRYNKLRGKQDNNVWRNVKWGLPVLKSFIDHSAFKVQCI
jgi:hypothetical protein